MHESLLGAKIRSRLDDRDNYTPGWKYNHWELKVRDDRARKVNKARPLLRSQAFRKITSFFLGGGV